MRALLVILGCLTVVTLEVRAAKLYLLGGQSNMQGIARFGQVAAEELKSFPEAYFWTGKGFERLVPGQTRSSKHAGHFGPELGLVLGLQASEPVYLVKYYASGMPLHPGWDGNRWRGGQGPGRRNFFPGLQADSEVQGSLYSAMLDRFRLARAALQAQGHEVELAGFLWMQGEQDAKKRESASEYAAHLKLLKRRLEEDLGVERPLTMVFGQVLPYPEAPPRFEARDLLRSQQVQAGREMEKAVMVSTDGFGLLLDTVHYNAAGQMALGRAFAKALPKE